jgi:hypothetical protein
MIETTVMTRVDGATYVRVPYGMEWFGTATDTCRDCGTSRYSEHVLGCCVEECPRCHEQLLSCGCFAPEDDEAYDLPSDEDMAEIVRQYYQDIGEPIA